MKKRSLALLLPITAGIALSGTGFGLWVFKETENFTNSVNISFELEAGMQIESLDLESAVFNGDSDAEDNRLIFKQAYQNATEAPWKVRIKISSRYGLAFAYSKMAERYSPDLGESPSDYSSSSYRAPSREELLQVLKDYSFLVEINSPMIAKNAEEEATTYLKYAEGSSYLQYIRLDKMVGAGSFEQILPDEEYTLEYTGFQNITGNADFELMPTDLYNAIDDPYKVLDFRDYLAQDTSKIVANVSLVDTPLELLD